MNSKIEDSITVDFLLREVKLAMNQSRENFDLITDMLESLKRAINNKQQNHNKAA